MTTRGPLSCTPGEREVLAIALKALRNARKHRGAVTMSLVFDPWIPKGMRGATITVSLDTTCEQHEVVDLGRV
jgi:hypothetical protein